MSKRLNAVEDYIGTPISVLAYINELEENLNKALLNYGDLFELVSDIDKVVIFDHLPNGNDLQERIEAVTQGGESE